MNDDFWEGFVRGFGSGMRKSVLLTLLCFVAAWACVTLFGVSLLAVVVLLGIAVVLGAWL